MYGIRLGVHVDDHDDECVNQVVDVEPSEKVDACVVCAERELGNKWNFGMNDNDEDDSNGFVLFIGLVTL